MFVGPQQVQHERHLGHFMQAAIPVAGRAGHPAGREQPGVIHERQRDRAREQARGELPSEHAPERGHATASGVQRMVPDVTQQSCCGPHSPTSRLNSSISTLNASYSAIFRFRNRAVRLVFAATPAGVSR